MLGLLFAATLKTLS